ncbi:hypothetical protein GA0004734_00016360 [Rhizobium sp. 9140]|nr:hypothetical protein GA0004734_00016360 [Rhizobium sp. 9140]
MPSRAPSICACGKAVPPGVTCACRARAAAERKARHDLRRPSSRDRGYDATWTREAKAFLARPENEFCSCGSPATLVRHVLSIRRAPHLRMNKSNWLAGCARCNARDAAREQQKEKT